MDDLQPLMPDHEELGQPVERPRFTVVPPTESPAAAARPLWAELQQIGSHGWAFIRHLLHTIAVACLAMWRAGMAFLHTERGRLTIAVVIGAVIGGSAVHYWPQRDAMKNRSPHIRTETAVSASPAKP